MSQITNLLTDLPASLHDVLIQSLLQTPHIRIERIVSLRHSLPQDYWYDQDENEWMLLIDGSARVRFEDHDESLEMKPGSFVNIPAHRRHRIEWTDSGQPTIWLAILYA